MQVCSSRPVELSVVKRASNQRKRVETNRRGDGGRESGERASKGEVGAGEAEQEASERRRSAPRCKLSSFNT